MAQVGTLVLEKLSVTNAMIHLKSFVLQVNHTMHDF